ncbi:MAG: hypothetical protein ACKO40_02790 [Planctomycetaceae bacterium]
MPSRGLAATMPALMLVAIACGAAAASDLPPELVGRFTRQVQPLIVNRCAAGACHGGPAGHEPRFERGPVSARPDRGHTLANISTFLKTVGADRDPAALVRMLAATHPTKPGRSRLAAAPLTVNERRTIETWLADVRLAEGRVHRDPAVQQASATMREPEPTTPNRLRALLDSAENPPLLEPPRQPPGVIFRNDDDSLPEPPLAPSPPEP